MNFIDLHADTPLCLLDGGKTPAVNLLHPPFERYLQTVAIWLDDGDSQPLETYHRLLTGSRAYLAAHGIPILKTVDKAEIDGVLFSVENASFLKDCPEFLQTMYKDGVRMLSLSWNGQNALAGGCHSTGGLQPAGADIIARVNTLGMGLDVAHLNPVSARQAIALADRPFASHANCFSVHPHPRNLPDDILLSIKEKQGIVGLCFYPAFLGFENPFLGLEKQILYLLSIGMRHCIAVGSDFDGAQMAPELSKTADVPLLYDYLQRRGMEQPMLDEIFYDNALAFLQKICKNK